MRDHKASCNEVKQLAVWALGSCRFFLKMCPPIHRMLCPPPGLLFLVSSLLLESIGYLVQKGAERKLQYNNSQIPDLERLSKAKHIHTLSPKPIVLTPPENTPETSRISQGSQIWGSLQVHPFIGLSFRPMHVTAGGAKPLNCCKSQLGVLSMLEMVGQAQTVIRLGFDTYWHPHV